MDLRDQIFKQESENTVQFFIEISKRQTKTGEFEFMRISLQF